uniref:Uncharacterized protein n=1 Tax=Alexandrium monilatum TaxID=311494 RepID=A0A7S4UIK9_9DINO
MAWNATLGCYEYPLVVGPEGRAEFRLLLEGDWERCVYPDRAEAGLEDGHQIQGPDDGGALGEWAIRGREGSRFRVHFYPAANRRPHKVWWEPSVDEASGVLMESGPLGENDQRDKDLRLDAVPEQISLDDLLEQVCPQWAGIARSELARMGIQDTDELKEAVAGSLAQWCKATLGERVVALLRKRFGIERAA